MQVGTTPAYMYGQVGILDVQVDIGTLVDHVVVWSQDELSAPTPQPPLTGDRRVMLWIKAFHIIAVIAWFAGVFYLPRLFVNHAMVEDEAT